MIEPEDLRKAPSDEAVQRLAAMVPEMQSRADALDHDEADPAEEIEALRQCGALAVVIPQGLGGAGFGVEAFGATGMFEVLRLLGRGNPAIGRIYEGHVNAFRLIVTYGSEAQIKDAAEDARAGHLFAIWNTERPDEQVCISETGQLSGAKSFCSAAGLATRPLITAQDTNGNSQMILLQLGSGERVRKTLLRTHGMRGAATGSVILDDLSVPASGLLGGPNDYLKEPAFSAGAWRASAVALGALEAMIGEARVQLVARGRDGDAIQRARMGETLIALETARLWTKQAAMIAEGEAWPTEEITGYVNLARNAVEEAALRAIQLVHRSIGLAGFIKPNPLERLTRDLNMYLRQPAPDEALTEAATGFFAKGRIIAEGALR
jgi:alkylation response protein AidB-like acyl-CoA dehydrogenase